MVGLPLLEIPDWTSGKLKEFLDEVDDDEEDKEDPGRYCQGNSGGSTGAHVTSYLEIQI